MLLLFPSQKKDNLSWKFHRFPYTHTLLLWSWLVDLGHSGAPMPGFGEPFVSCCPPGVHLRLVGAASLALGLQRGSRQCLVARLDAELHESVIANVELWY